MQRYALTRGLARNINNRRHIDATLRSTVPALGDGACLGAPKIAMKALTDYPSGRTTGPVRDAG
jgi:hypothetical protein